VMILMASVTPPATLLEAMVPVQYHWGPHAIRNIAYTPAPPAVLDDNIERVDATFDYVTSDPGGVRIFFRPYTDAPCTYSPSPLYPMGDGSGTAFLKILSGQTTVSRVSFEMWNAGTTTRRLNVDRDVLFFFGGPGVAVHVPERAAAPLMLWAACPNPFNPRTTIRFDLPAAGNVRLAVYDVAGRLVRVLVEEEMVAGSQEAVWDGRDATGRAAPSGNYLARLVAGGKVEAVRLSLVR